MMFAAIVVFTAVLVAAVGYGVVWLRRDTDRVVARFARENVVVTLKDGATFRGVLFETDATSIVLRDAYLLARDGSKPVGVDGELVLARGDISYMQRP